MRKRFVDARVAVLVRRHGALVEMSNNLGNSGCRAEGNGLHYTPMSRADSSRSSTGHGVGGLAILLATYFLIHWPGAPVVARRGRRCLSRTRFATSIGGRIRILVIGFARGRKIRIAAEAVAP